MTHPEKIIAPGPFPARLVQVREARRRLRTEARLRRSDELETYGFWKRVRIRLAIEREVQAELDKIYPPGALYIAGSREDHARSLSSRAGTPGTTGRL